MERIWDSHLHETNGKAAIVMETALALRDGSRADDTSTRGREAAHQLIGVLSIFGRKDLSILARRAEALFRMPSRDAKQDEELVSIARSLCDGIPLPRP